MTFIVNVLLACIFLYCEAVLFASTVRVGRFLSRVSYLLWHVFLPRRHSFTSKKL